MTGILPRDLQANLHSLRVKISPATKPFKGAGVREATAEPGGLARSRLHTLHNWLCPAHAAMRAIRAVAVKRKREKEGGL